MTHCESYMNKGAYHLKLLIRPQALALVVGVCLFYRKEEFLTVIKKPQVSKSATTCGTRGPTDPARIVRFGAQY